MTIVHYTAKVKGGLLLELPIEAEELHLKPGDSVQIQVDQLAGDTPAAQANEGMIAALQGIAERQQHRRFTDASNTDNMLREGRAGAMWGCEPVE